MAQTEVSLVDAIDINTAAVACSQKNFQQSRHSKKLRAIHADYKQYLENILDGYYQLIVCNPPYHETAKEYRSSFRQIAREEKNFDLVHFISLALRKSPIVIITIPDRKYTALMIQCYAAIPKFNVMDLFYRSSITICVFGIE